MERAAPDRLRFLIDTIIDALDDKIDGDELAKRAYLSRFHFDRLVARGLGEAPATFRRRLLLERAAWQLRTDSVTEAALSAGYNSIEAFTRAFTRAYGPGNVVDRLVGREESHALLAQHVFLKEVWIAAIDGTKFSENPDDSLKGLRSRHEVSARRFREIARNVCDRGEWDDAFVDALCEPPHSFTYGSVVAHIIEHSAHRRGMIIAALRELGVSDVDSSCAIDWEKKLND